MATEMEERGVLNSDLEFELHELCQPLTTLRCRLELAMMCSEDEPGGREALIEAVEGGLQDVRRIFACVDRLRERLIGVPEEGSSDHAG
jgi:signal transduction histidine kinase